MKRKRLLCLLFSFLFVLYGCDGHQGDEESTTPSTKEETALSDFPSSPSPTIDDLLLAESPEKNVLEDDEHKVHIDYSHTNLGYIRIKRLDDSGINMKIRLTNNGEGNYWYDLNKTGVYETFPLVNGSGTYQLEVRIQVPSTGKYALVYGHDIEVSLDNEQTPYLYPNQTVDYDQNSKAIQKAFALCKDDDNALKRVKSIYDYVVNDIQYDYDKLEETKDKYVLPVLDETLDKKKGICFDYAALMAGMCRSQHIPCKVIVGDTEMDYHAWVEVWLEGKGWIDPAILFEKDTWTRMDPTYASTHANYNGEYITKYVY